jgi:hypothetical protein
MNAEFENTWDEVVRGYFVLIFQSLLEEMRKTIKKPG